MANTDLYEQFRSVGINSRKEKENIDFKFCYLLFRSSTEILFRNKNYFYMASVHK